MRNERMVISHFHTQRSVQLRMKKESRDLLASAGHLCAIVGCLLSKDEQAGASDPIIRKGGCPQHVE